MVTVTMDIAKAEFAERVQKVREAMRQQGLDALINYDEDRNLGAAGVRNLAGFTNFPSPIPGVVVIPPQGDPILCIQPGMGNGVLTYAEMHSVWPVKASPTAQFRSELVKDISEALREGGFTRGRLGIDGLPQMPHVLYEGLRQQFSDSEFVNVTGLVEKTRIVKSPAEHRLFREAGRLSQVGMDAFLSAAKPGTRQALAVAAADHAALAEGAEEAHLIMAAGDPWIWGTGNRRGDLVFKEGDLLAVELNARYRGYYGQRCRTIAIGQVSEEKQRIIEAVRAAHDRMLSLLKPGKTGDELFKAGLEEVEKRGFKYSGIRYGHGLGVTIGEGFDFRPGDMTPIPEGAIGVFHPFIIREDERGRGVFNALWGDPWILRSDGPELV